DSVRAVARDLDLAVGNGAETTVGFHRSRQNYVWRQRAPFERGDGADNHGSRKRAAREPKSTGESNIDRETFWIMIQTHKAIADSCFQSFLIIGIDHVRVVVENQTKRFLVLAALNLNEHRRKHCGLRGAITMEYGNDGDRHHRAD